MVKKQVVSILVFAAIAVVSFAAEWFVPVTAPDWIFVIFFTIMITSLIGVWNSIING